MLGLWLCLGLIVVGSLPILPIFLGRARRGTNPAARRAAAWVAFFLLWACFSITAAGLLLTLVVPLLLADNGMTAVIAVVLFTSVGAWLSQRVAFGK